MANKKIIDRQWPLAALVFVEPKNIGADKGYSIVVPPGALVLRVSATTHTAFNGTTATLTVGDGTTTYVSAVDIKSLGAETATGVPKYYPTGGTITVSAAETGTNTAGLASVAIEYVIRDRGNEIVD